MPSTPAAALAPNAISWKAFWVVVAVIIARVTSLADFVWPPPELELEPPPLDPPHAATPRTRATTSNPADRTVRGERRNAGDIDTLRETRTVTGRRGGTGSITGPGRSAARAGDGARGCPATRRRG